jgi:hypothetical protein
MSYQRYYQAEYDRLLPRLTAAYEHASPTEQQRLSQLDEAFRTGDRRRFIAWARTVIPAAFSHPVPDGPAPRQPRPRLPDRPGARALEPLPEWWPDEPVYHGTRAWAKIKQQGLHAPLAEDAAPDPDYGWDAVWKSELYESYRHHLSPAQRRQFHHHFGSEPGLLSMRALGQLVSLFWISRQRRVAASYGGIEGGQALQVDLHQLRYYWWFSDEILGDASYVFVLPADGPQALPSAFTPV